MVYFSVLVMESLRTLDMASHDSQLPKGHFFVLSSLQCQYELGYLQLFCCRFVHLLSFPIVIPLKLTIARGAPSDNMSPKFSGHVEG